MAHSIASNVNSARLEREIVTLTSANVGEIARDNVSKIYRTESPIGLANPTYAQAIKLQNRKVKCEMAGREEVDWPRDPAYFTRSPYDYENKTDRRMALKAANRIYGDAKTPDARDEAFKIYDEIIKHTSEKDLDSDRGSRSTYRAAAVALSEMYAARGTASGVMEALDLLGNAAVHFRGGEDKCAVEYLHVKVLLSMLGREGRDGRVGSDDAAILEEAKRITATAKDRHHGVSFFSDIIEGLESNTPVNWTEHLQQKVQEEPAKAYYFGKMLFKGAKVGSCDVTQDLAAARKQFESVKTLSAGGVFNRMGVDSRGYLALIDAQEGKGKAGDDIDQINKDAQSAGVSLKSSHAMGFYDVVSKVNLGKALGYLETAWARGVARAKGIFRSLYQNKNGGVDEGYLNNMAILPKPKVCNHVETGPDGCGLVGLTMLSKIASDVAAGGAPPSFFTGEDAAQALKKGRELRRTCPGLMDLGGACSNETKEDALERMSVAHEFSGAVTSMVSMTPFSAPGWSTHASGRPPVFFLKTAEVCSKQQAEAMHYVVHVTEEDGDGVLRFKESTINEGNPESKDLEVVGREGDGETVAVRFRDTGHKMESNHFRREELRSGRLREKVGGGDADRPVGGRYGASLVQRGKGSKQILRPITEHVAEEAAVHGLKHEVYVTTEWGGHAKDEQYMGGITETYCADPTFPKAVKSKAIQTSNVYDGEFCGKDMRRELSLMGETGDVYLTDRWLDLYIKCLEHIETAGLQGNEYDVQTVLPRLRELQGVAADVRRDHAIKQWGDDGLYKLLGSCYDSNSKHMTILVAIEGARRQDQMNAGLLFLAEAYTVPDTVEGKQKLAIHNGVAADLQNEFFLPVLMHQSSLTDALGVRDFETKAAGVKNDEDRRGKVCQVINQFGCVDHVAHFSTGTGGQSLSNPQVLYGAFNTLAEFTKASAVNSRPGDFVAIVSDHGNAGFADPEGFEVGEVVTVEGKDYIRGVPSGGYACMNQFSSHGQTVSFTDRLGIFGGYIRGDLPGEQSSDHRIKQGAELVHEDHFLNLQASMVSGRVPQPEDFPMYSPGVETLNPGLIKNRYRLTGWQSLSFDVRSGDLSEESLKSDRMMSQQNFYGPNYLPVCVGDLAFRAQTVIQRLAPKTISVEPDTKTLYRGGVTYKDAAPLYPNNKENQARVAGHLEKAEADAKVLKESEAYRLRMVENHILYQQLGNLLDMMELEGILSADGKEKVRRLTSEKDIDLDIWYTLSAILQEKTVQGGLNIHNRPLKAETMMSFRTRAELVGNSEDKDLKRFRVDVIDSLSEDIQRGSYSVEFSAD